MRLPGTSHVAGAVRSATDGRRTMPAGAGYHEPEGSHRPHRSGPGLSGAVPAASQRSRSQRRGAFGSSSSRGMSMPGLLRGSCTDGSCDASAAAA